jgi:hypothetical protein
VVSEILFLAGTEPATATNKYYGLAKQFFLQRDASIPAVGPAAGNVALSLESVFAELTRRAAASPPEIFDTISIVSHATGMGGMDLPLRKSDELRGGVTMRGSLSNAVLAARAKTAGALQPPGGGAVTPKTRIVLYGCDVGRDLTFLTALGELFGGPGEVSAPIRVAVFRLKDGKVQHRLARTWSVLWGKASIEATKPADWPTVRSTFTGKTDLKFITDITVSSVIRSAAASAALDWAKDAFFFGEVFSVAKTAFATVLPVRSAVITSTDDDDTTVPVVITAADLTPGNADFTDPDWPTMNIAMLASVIDVDVAVRNSTQYRTVSFASQKAPAKGPAPAPTADGSPPPPPTDPDTPVPDAVQEFSEAFLADGGQQAELDAFLADVTPAEADVTVAVEDGAEPPVPADEFLSPPPPSDDNEGVFA